MAGEASPADERKTNNQLPRHSRRADSGKGGLRPPAQGRSREQLRAIVEGLALIAAPVASSADEVLARIATVAMAVTGARYCALGIGTDPAQQFNPWVFAGMGDEKAREIGRTPRPVCLLGAVPHGGHTIRLAEMSKDPRFCGFPAGHPPMRSFLGVPIRLNEQSIGNLYLTDKAGASEFSEEDQLIVEALAVHAGVAMQSAQLYEEARRRTAELEEERSQRETFISVVSHELRGPISVLIGYSDLLPMWERLPAARRERALKAIGAQARQMERLIADLLDTSRLQTGRFQLEPGRTDLGEIARAVVEAQQATAPERTITLDAPPHVPLEGDQGRLSQALTNLVGNALKYSPEGGPVAVRVAVRPDEVEVAVADEGLGLTPDQMAHLFQPYSRLHRQQKAPGGIGLGLFITKGIVEAHGGRIWADSPGAGQGTTFRFTLPRKG